MGVHRLRREIAKVLETAELQVLKLRDELDNTMEADKLTWVNSSPRRRLIEDRVDDTLITVDHALDAMKKARLETLGGRDA